MAEDSFKQYCIAVCKVPKCVSQDKLIRVVEDISETSVENISVVEGAENDKNLEKYVLKLHSPLGVKRLHEDLCQTEIKHAGEYYTIDFEECLNCEIPLDWIGDIETDGDPDPDGTPKPKSRSESPTPGEAGAITPQNTGPAYPTPLVDRTFYQNYPNSPFIAASQGYAMPGQPSQGLNMQPGNAGAQNIPQGHPQGLNVPQGQGHSQNIPQGQPGMFNPMFFPGQGGMPNTGPRFGYPPNFPFFRPGFDPSMFFRMPGQFQQQPDKGDNPQNYNTEPRARKSPPPPYSSGEQPEPMDTDNATNVKEKIPFSEEYPLNQAINDQGDKLRRFGENNGGEDLNDMPDQQDYGIYHQEPTNKIIIKGLPVDADEEYIELVFEKKQFGNPEVENIEIDRELNMALVVFGDVKAVEKILSHPEAIKLKKVEVRIQPYYEVEEEAQPLCTVEVTGLDGLDEESVEMYFESEKRAGGDEIQNLQFDESGGRAFITYKTEEVARRVVDRGNHSLSRKQLDVTLYQPPPKNRWNLRTPSPEPQMLPCDTICVTGFDESMDRDSLEMYFENEKRAGGGEIKDVQIRGNTAYITFMSEEVAKRVVDKGQHILNRCELEVSLVKPGPSDRGSYERQPSVELKCTIQITGFDESADKETLEMYFENTKRSGGGDISETHLDEVNLVAYITFDDEDVAQRVLGRDHTLNRKSLYVTLYRTARHTQSPPSPEPEPEPITAIEIHGVGPSMDEESLEMYFENEKRSGGGDIVDTRLDRDEGIAYIDFGSEEIAKRVVEKGNHTLNRRELNVKLHIKISAKPEAAKRRSYASQRSRDSERTEDGGQTDSSVVKVKGVKRVTSLETMRYYFENRRRSDGGEIVDLTHHEDDDDIVLITFQDAEAAKRVVQREHSVDNQVLEVSLHVPPKPRPFYEDKLLIRGLKDTTTRDCLFNFLEAKSGSVPTELLKGEFEGVVLVTFENQPDFQKLVSVLARVPLEGARLEVSRVEISNCIIVLNIPDEASQDTIQFYFENTRRSNGGEIDKIVMRDDGISCLVYFMDYNVVEAVLQNTHVLQKVTLIVKLYLDCLGCPGGDEQEMPLKLPDVIAINDVDSKKIKFMKNSTANKLAIEMQMSGVNAEIIWPEKVGKEKDSLKQQNILIKCTITKDMKNAKKLVKTWREDAVKNFEDFMKNIVVKTLSISQELWNVVMDKLRALQIKSPESVAVLIDKDQHTISIVGLNQAVDDVSRDLSTMIRDIEDEAAKEKERTKETLTNLKLIETKMLLAEKFPAKMEQKFPNLKVKINQNKNEIVFDGSLKDIGNAKIDMYEMKEDFASKTVDMTGCRPRFLLYENKPVKDYIVKKLKNNQIAAVWEVRNEELVVCSTSNDTLDKSIELVKKSVVENSISLSRESVTAVQSENWRTFVEEQSQRNPGKMSFEIQSGKLYVCSTDDIEKEVLGIAKRFLKLNTILEEHVDFSRNINKLIEKDHKEDIAIISKKFASLNAQISPKADYSGFVIRGTEDGLQAIKRELEDLKRKVIVKDHTLKSPGIEAHMKSKGQEHMNAVEGQYPVVFDTSDSGAEYEELDNIQIAGPKVHAEFRAYNDRKIYTAEGDMTELRVDVLVNTADSKLSLTGGLGKAIVNKGGNEIVDACKAYIRDEGELGEGEAFISPAGRLRANYVVHIVGPVWKGGTNNEEIILGESVLKAMKQATVKDVKSIALPAISCGVYGFPAKRATKIIVQGVKNFFREVQESTIMEVYLCDVKSNTIDGFNEALIAEFGDKNFRKLSQASATARPKLPPPRKKGTYSMMTKASSDSDDEDSFQGARFKTMPDRNSDGVQVGGITITVKKGEIAKESVDVIVNTTARNLDLKNGAVSASLLRAAGNKLQSEVSTKYPNGIKDGEIAVTTGQSLRCKIIIHTSLMNWDGKNNEAKKALHTLMNNCLNEADTKRHQSIAFPAIGTGNLGFPRDVVAKEMFTVISNFSRDNPRSSITDVRFIVYQKDTGTISAFEAEERSRQSRDGANRNRQSRNLDHTYENFRVVQQSDSDDDKMVQTVHKLYPLLYIEGSVQDCKDSDGSGAYDDIQEDDSGRLTVTVEQGDITKVTCDAIVNSSNEDLDLSKGAVSQALKKIGGQSLEKECKAKAQAMKNNQIVVTAAPGFPFKGIIHVVAQDSTKSWRRMIDKCFQMAEEQKLKSIAFPALGTNIQANPSDIANAMVSSLRDFEAKPHEHLKEVKFIIFQKGMVETFQKALQNTKKPSKGLLSALYSGVKAGFGYGAKPKEKQSKAGNQGSDKGRPGGSDTYDIRIYSMSSQTIQRAIQKLETLIKDEVTCKHFEDKILGNLKDNEKKQLVGIQNDFGVQIKFVSSTKLQVTGMIQNVLDASTKIHNIIRELDRVEHQKKEASRISKMVQWHFIDVTELKQELVEYDPSVNMLIENAFNDGQPTVAFSSDNKRGFCLFKVEDAFLYTHPKMGHYNKTYFADNEGQKYIIDFAKMHEYPEGDPKDFVNVIRRDRLKGGSFEVPPTWTPMADENLRVITLQNSSQEFTDLVNNFTRSVGGASFTVTKIDRIQNKTLWMQYQAKKQQLESTNKGVKNESILWHGTTIDSVDSINANGFNRSYCGKNATAFGDGVYFAVNASYSCSDTYSRPDGSGVKRMYCCCVLTGEYAMGKSGMRVPPTKGGASGSLYDSVVNNVSSPSMFVIFHDTQAYPQYLIHFKKK